MNLIKEDPKTCRFKPERLCDDTCGAYSKEAHACNHICALYAINNQLVELNEKVEKLVPLPNNTFGPD